jgi:hypothetical protein
VVVGEAHDVVELDLRARERRPGAEIDVAAIEGVVDVGHQGELMIGRDLVRADDDIAGE